MSIEFSKTFVGKMDLKDRLQFIIKNNKINPNISEYEFAKSVGTYPAKFAEIRSGKVKTLSIDVALEISKQYGFNFLWILTGEGDAFKSFQDNSNTITLPIKGNVEASMGYGVTVYDETPTATYTLDKQLANSLNINTKMSEIIFARGDSMEPTIYGGDSLLVDRSKTDILDGVIYCIRLDGQLLAKRLQKVAKTVVAIVSDNSKYKTREINLNDESEDFLIIGEVKWWGRIAK